MILKKLSFENKTLSLVCLESSFNVNLKIRRYGEIYGNASPFLKNNYMIHFFFLTQRHRQNYL